MGPPTKRVGSICQGRCGGGSGGGDGEQGEPGRSGGRDSSARGPPLGLRIDTLGVRLSLLCEVALDQGMLLIRPGMREM